jgi:hypothetical protein
VADVKQFGIQFGTAGNQSGSSGDCARCEAMLADAADGVLSAADQEFFDAHVAECGPCAELLAASRRGAAWLEMLRKPAPEPSPALLEKILAQTAGAAGATGVTRPVALGQPAPAMAPGYQPAHGYVLGNAPGSVIAFPQYSVVRRSSLMQVMRQPRMAMTAAMAFLSIALTMDLMGVNPLNLRASDLSPSSLKRAFFEADARVVQYYEGLRVVYEMESRLRDFENVQGNAQDNTQGTQEPGAGQPVATPATPAGRPEGQDQTAPRQQEPKDGGASEQTKPDAGAGEGHSERVREKTTLVAMEQGGARHERRADANRSIPRAEFVQRMEQETEYGYAANAYQRAERRAA